MRETYQALATRGENGYLPAMKKMRRLSLSAAALSVGLLAALAPGAARAQGFAPENGFGIGFVLGKPSGLTASLPIGDARAINAVLGYDLAGDANLFLQGDYVWIRPGIVPVESGRVSLYYGPGAYARLARNPAIGVRAAVGVDYRFAEAPLQIFLEVGPGVNVLPDTEVGVGAGLGLRYYF
jgi:hypothetical protein